MISIFIRVLSETTSSLFNPCQNSLNLTLCTCGVCQYSPTWYLPNIFPCSVHHCSQQDTDSICSPKHLKDSSKRISSKCMISCGQGSPSLVFGVFVFKQAMLVQNLGQPEMWKILGWLRATRSQSTQFRMTWSFLPSSTIAQDGHTLQKTIFCYIGSHPWVPRCSWTTTLRNSGQHNVNVAKASRSFSPRNVGIHCSIRRCSSNRGSFCQKPESLSMYGE